MATDTIERPACVTGAHLEYLDELRASGETNMFFARRYVIAEFDCSDEDAAAILSYWMKTFGARHAGPKP